MQLSEKALEAAKDAYGNTYEAEYFTTGATDNSDVALEAAIEAYLSTLSVDGVEPVAWRYRAGEKFPSENFYYREDEPIPTGICDLQPLYPAATIAALQARCAALQHDVDSQGALRARMEAHKDTARKVEAALAKSEQRVAELKTQVESLVAVWDGYQEKWTQHPMMQAQIKSARATLATLTTEDEGNG